MTALLSPTRSSSTRSWVPFAGLMIALAIVESLLSYYSVLHQGAPVAPGVVQAVVLLVVGGALVAVQGPDLRPVALRCGLCIAGTGILAHLTTLLLTWSNSTGSAWPWLQLHPAVTIALGVLLLRERLGALTAAGASLALVAGVMMQIPPESFGGSLGWWVLLVPVFCVMQGAQAYWIRRAFLLNVNVATVFASLAVATLVTTCIDLVRAGIPRSEVSLAGVATMALIQLCSALGTLAFVLALSRGRASVVAPVTTAAVRVATLALLGVLQPYRPSGWILLGLILAVVGIVLVLLPERRAHPAPDPAAPGNA